MTIGKQWAPDEVPEMGFITYPDGLLTVKVKSQEDAETKNGKYQIKVETRVVRPAKFKNQPFNFNFVIGSDSDLEADEPTTWTTPPSVYAVSRYKAFLKACGVAFAGDTEEEAQNTPGNIIVVDVGHHTVEKEGGSTLTYNDTKAFYSEQAAPGGDEPTADAPLTAKPSANGTKPSANKLKRPAPQPAADETEDWTAVDVGHHTVE